MSCDIKNEICGASCTGYQGSEIWKKRRQLIKEIDCESCQEHANKNETGYHDHVNAMLGKPIHDEANLRRYYDEHLCVCKKRGYC